MLKGRYNIGNASKIKNKASKANLESLTSIYLAAKRFKTIVKNALQKNNV